MSPTRRMRTGIFLGLLALLTIIYITTGAKQTRNSQFYTRTVSRIEHKAREEAEIANALKPPEPLPEMYHHQAPIQAAPTEGLKERLKQAEEAAKKSADAKWRDIESELASTTADQAIDHVTKSTGRTRTQQHQEEKKEKDTISPDTEIAQMLNRSPVVIFSKTFCPYSRKAKHILLDIYTITPPPYVVELDKHERGSDLQDALQERTGRRTVPNIMIQGQSIGGGDDIEALWRSGKLQEKIEKIAGSSVVDVVENMPYSSPQQ